MRSNVLALLSGALMMAYIVIGLFFLKFARPTRDRLFTSFAAAFFLLAFQRVMLPIGQTLSENVVWIYGLRLLAFVIIIAAIVDKNFRTAR